MADLSMLECNIKWVLEKANCTFLKKVMVKECSILQCYQEQDSIAQIQYVASKDFLTSGINNAKLNSRHMEE